LAEEAARKHRKTRPQLFTREQLDKRTNACKLFDRLCADIEADLGGREQLSTIERQLIEAFAGAAVTMSDLNCRIALGRRSNPANMPLRYRQWCVWREAWLAAPGA